MNPSQTGTFGVFRSDITKMRIGDYTCAMYALDTTDDPDPTDITRDTDAHVHENYLGKFSQLGTADQNTPEFNINTDLASRVTNGLVWLVKIKKGVLIPTRCLVRGNYAIMGYYFGLVNGRKITIDDRDFIMQLPSVDDYQALISDMSSNTASALVNLIEDDFHSEFVRNYYRYPEQAEAGSYNSSGSIIYSTAPIEMINISDNDYNRNLDTGYYIGNNGPANRQSEQIMLQLQDHQSVRPVLKYVDDPRCQSIYV